MSVVGTTWTINSNVDMYSACNGILNIGVGSFISNNVTYTSTSGNSGKTTDTAYYGSTLIWDSDTGWYDEAYRTIEIISVESAYQSDLETWLNVNAVEVVPVVPVDYLTTDVEITSIADAIRSKGGTSSSLVYPTGFVSAINAISTGTDVSDTTATASDVRTGKYFYTSAGTKTQGSISDMTLPTSTAASADGTNKATISRSTSDQYINIPTGYNASKASYKVNAVANGSATTPATTITANPSISVNSSGLITATASATQSVTPTVSAGYVSSGTAGTITVSGSNTSQLTTQAAQTIHPSTTDQTIASGKYLTGTQTVKGVLLTNLDAGNIKKDVVVKVGDSTDDDCVTSVTGTYEGISGSSYTLVLSTEAEVNTSSTSETSVTTLQCGSSIWTSAKIILVQIRDKAGKRPGYFLGTDNYYLNQYPANSASTSNLAYSYRTVMSYTTASKFSPVYNTAYGIYSARIDSSGNIGIYARYNSTNSKTINGTYSIKVYTLDFPDNISIFS